MLQQHIDEFDRLTTALKVGKAKFDLLQDKRVDLRGLAVDYGSQADNVQREINALTTELEDLRTQADNLKEEVLCVEYEWENITVSEGE